MQTHTRNEYIWKPKKGGIKNHILLQYQTRKRESGGKINNNNDDDHNNNNKWEKGERKGEQGYLYEYEMRIRKLSRKSKVVVGSFCCVREKGKRQTQCFLLFLLSKYKLLDFSTTRMIYILFCFCITICPSVVFSFN